MWRKRGTDKERGWGEEEEEMKDGRKKLRVLLL